MFQKVLCQVICKFVYYNIYQKPNTENESETRTLARIGLRNNRSQTLNTKYLYGKMFVYCTILCRLINKTRRLVSVPTEPLSNAHTDTHTDTWANYGAFAP